MDDNTENSENKYKPFVISGYIATGSSILLILALLLTLSIVIIGMATGYELSSDFGPYSTPLIILLVISAFFGIIAQISESVMYFGFFKMAKDSNCNLLKISSISITLYPVIVLLFVGLPMIFMLIPMVGTIVMFIAIIFSFILSILYMLAVVLFGISQIQQSNITGERKQMINGVLHIVAGIFLFLFSPVAMILTPVCNWLCSWTLANIEICNQE
jgi:hypothetical protein